MFTPYTRDTGKLQPWEYLPASAGSYKIGQALRVSDGVLLPVSGTGCPDYVCMYDGTTVQGQIIPVIRVTERLVFETELSSDAADAKIGSKLQVSADSMGVDGAATGAFHVSYIEDTAAGSIVRGRFK